MTPIINQVLRKKQKFNSIVDSFNRANSNTTLGHTDTGQPWETLGEVIMGINSNLAYTVSSNGDTEALVESGISDFTLQVTFAANPVVALCVFRAKDHQNLWKINANKSINKYRLIKLDNGVSSVAATGSIAINNGDVVKVVCNGSVIKVYINDILDITYTDSFNQNETKHGLGAFTTATDTRWDNFSLVVI